MTPFQQWLAAALPLVAAPMQPVPVAPAVMAPQSRKPMTIAGGAAVKAKGEAIAKPKAKTSAL